MVKITGYKKVDYNEFWNIMQSAYKKGNKTHFQISKEIDVKSVQTSANAFKKGEQVVSDEVLTKVIDTVGVNGLVLWSSGEKYYYIKNK